ncbi:musculoskeletal, embryonic nuclear protein 1 [Rattus norvegicus]|uniref:Musculoskeletal, embryonic nuclear protein 1 n=1 Tax=Rattus norvegicus TaxID=10116 RepID=A6KG23_RAT|nr:musculoskeletal, embryonic nuclear protein 1 [Rattus norvegicus]
MSKLAQLPHLYSAATARAPRQSSRSPKRDLPRASLAEKCTLHYTPGHSNLSTNSLSLSFFFFNAGRCFSSATSGTILTVTTLALGNTNKEYATWEGTMATTCRREGQHIECPSWSPRWVGE